MSTEQIRALIEWIRPATGGDVAELIRDAEAELDVLESAQPLDATWNAAIEAAAKAAEAEDEYSVAIYIRSIKRGQPPASARPPCDSCHERPRAAGLSVCESCAKGIYGRKVTP